MRVQICCLLFSASLLVPLSQFAETTASAPVPAVCPFDAPAFSIGAATLQKDAAAVSADNTSDATILYQESDYDFSADGRVRYSVRLVYRVETQAGVREWAEAGVTWDPWYQNQPEIQARVLRPDGSFSTLDPKTITDAPVDSNEPETYTSRRIRKAPLPGIAVGSIVEEVLTISEKRPYFAGGTVHRYPLISSAPASYQKVVVTLPLSMPFHDNVSDAPGLAVARAEKGGIRQIVYRRDNVPAYIASDIDLPSSSAPVPFVEFSTANSWAEVARGYAALADPSTQPDQVRSLLPERGEKDRVATIQMLVERLHKEVRYTGVEFNQAEIVPETPAEVLRRHYGDCKDKANLLVSMLRAGKIPAYLALLSAGQGRDINPDLPGLNRFNHAIVYVPASGHDPALWIDATAEYYSVGTLPYEDKGRYALVIAPDTTGLIKTPEPLPEDSRLVETRTFQLADQGRAQVVESSETHGTIDALYRALYGGPATQKIHDNLESYGKRVYLAKTLSKITHGDAAELTKPFDLTLTFDGTRRGYTSMDEASAAIFPTAALNYLPQWFSTQPPAPPDNPTAQQKQQQARREAMRSPTYNIRPFIVEERNQVVAPAGFVLRALPPDKTTAVGPATLTEHYTLAKPNMAIADFRFTTGKSAISAQEALDMRKAVLELNKRNAITIDFEQAGVKLQAEGKFKEAIAADREAISEEPKSALAHVHLARLLLDLGVGDLARQEAKAAVAIDPKSVVALDTLGWVLEFDSMGTRFGEGFDRAGAIAAYEKALSLRTDDFDPRFDLAVLDEFDANGVRYAPDANLADAIALYRSLIADDTKNNSSQLDQHRINLGFALLYDGDYDELEKLLPEMATGTERSVMTIADAAARKDAKAGIAAADQLNLSTDDRNKALTIAGNDLAQMGMYPAAADLLSAGMQGDDDATATARKIAIFRKLHRVPLESPPVTTPESAVFADLNMKDTGDVTPEKIRTLYSPHSFSSKAELKRFIDAEMGFRDWLQTKSRRENLSYLVERDLRLSGSTITCNGSDESGYRVLVQTPEGDSYHYFVVREGNNYRLLANGSGVPGAGNFALYALDHHQEKIAKSILDWEREMNPRPGGDDPLAGVTLPRFWTVNSSRPGANSPEAMRIAAVSLLLGSVEIAPYLQSVEVARQKAAATQQTDFDLLLGEGYLWSGHYAQAMPYLDRLNVAEPDSNFAHELKVRAYTGLGDSLGWKKFIDTELKQKPDDPELLRLEGKYLAAHEDFSGTRRIYKKVFSSGQVGAFDYNVYAWSGLFDNSLGPDVTSAAHQADAMDENRSWGVKQALACIYAAQDKVTEARQELAQTLSMSEMAQPDSSVWLVIGLLDEDYGLNQEAIHAYRQISNLEDDGQPDLDPLSFYELAQRRIAALTGKQYIAMSGGVDARRRVQ